ncbi:hypothetical protein PANDA_005725 [Ailuropoda melanoleuca]|uniref:26S proteasome non-ATPase regulatory subunit 1/RPN2 N-terminal domain-containing protein n=1 Tax=Ailuropoda melanoleuca TaxID=9646 RepID=D2H6U0_AILME|nr:hypothetical protein PANDA_005725 [Ailuropoda melanoleuca]
MMTQWDTDDQVHQQTWKSVYAGTAGPLIIGRYYTRIAPHTASHGDSEQEFELAKCPWEQFMQQDPGRDRAFQRCWRAFPGVPGAEGRIQMPPSPVTQLRYLTPRLTVQEESFGRQTKNRANLQRGQRLRPSNQCALNKPLLAQAENPGPKLTGKGDDSRVNLIAVYTSKCSSTTLWGWFPVVEFALHKLNAVVNDFWAEISESVDKIEVLYEDEGFRSRQFAALVASKVFYHLGAFEESLNYALGAGDLFNVNDNSEYVETIIAKCIDHYTKQCVENADLPEGEKKPIDQRLEGIVNKMFQRCLDDHKYKQAIGIALETRRLDVFEKTILESNDVPGMLAYSLKLCMSLMQNKQFRNKVLRVLVKIYMNLEKPDFINVCQCLIFLDDPQAVSDILEKLVKEDNLLMAYQICFDLYESASQQFLSSVIQNLRTVGTPIASVPGSTNTGTVPGSEKDSESMETEEKTGSVLVGKTPEVQSPEPKDQTLKMIKILSGEMAIELHLQFLIRNNNTDLMILKNTKGHEKEALQLMATYLPKDTSPGSAYQEGGGLYALGLIHANHGGDIIDYLLNQLKNASNDIVRHGGSLGLGLAAMGTARQDVYDLLKTNLYQDDAVTGEAAGLALGLVMLGSKNAQAIEDMVGYAQETQHEKILRGLAVGIALVMYGRMEEADALIESLCRDKDPILRRSGMYTVAMAYCGSGNNKAIRRLLHVALTFMLNAQFRQQMSPMSCF